MTEQNEADRLTRNLFLDYLMEVNKILNDNKIVKFSERFQLVREHFVRYVDRLLTELQSMSEEAQANHIDRLKRNCRISLSDAEVIREMQLETIFDGTTISKMHLWINKFRELVRNLVPDQASFGAREPYLRNLDLASQLWAFQQIEGHFPDQRKKAPQEDAKKTIEPTQIPLRLKWHGEKNVLYHIFAQCLNPPNGKPHLTETAEDIARFILSHFDGIDANQKTIAAEISRYRTEQKKSPKRPVKVEPPKEN